MPTDSFQIQDIIELKKLELLLEDFSAATGFPTGLVDPTNNLLISTGWRDICTIFHHAHPEAKKQCMAFNVPKSNQANHDQEIHIRHCPNGLIEGFSPIIIDDQHLATLFSGQALFGPADKEIFRKKAERYGFDSDHYLAALDEVPLTNEEKFLSILGFLAKTIHRFAKTGLENYQSQQEG